MARSRLYALVLKTWQNRPPEYVMSVWWKKLKVGPRQLTPEEIVAYIAEPQPSGDYYSEAGQALMMWHVTERAAVVLGIAQSGERPSQQEVGRKTLSLLISGVNPRTGERIRKAGPDGTSVGALDLTVSPAPKSVSVLWAWVRGSSATSWRQWWRCC